MPSSTECDECCRDTTRTSNCKCGKITTYGSFFRYNGYPCKEANAMVNGAYCEHGIRV